MNKRRSPAIDKATLYRLAADASCDPRTVQAVFEGKEVRGMAGERARDVLVKNGLLQAVAK